MVLVAPQHQHLQVEAVARTRCMPAHTQASLVQARWSPRPPQASLSRCSLFSVSVPLIMAALVLAPTLLEVLAVSRVVVPRRIQWASWRRTTASERGE